MPPAAIKTGMLYSEAIVRATAEFLARRRPAAPPVIVDPVMVATSGGTLLRPGAVRAVQSQLLPLATLVTPNLDEAVLLTGHPIRTPEDLRHAARRLHEAYGCAVLAKGGHLRGLKEAIDVFYDGKNELLLSAPFVRGVSTHGTGCTYSAAIAAHSARGLPLIEAVAAAKQFISVAIADSILAGRHHPVLHWRAAGAAA
jgi:hydroxymethylpyrimidine kinase/phosphomethylpyrimidine kinase